MDVCTDPNGVRDDSTGASPCRGAPGNSKLAGHTKVWNFIIQGAFKKRALYNEFQTLVCPANFGFPGTPRQKGAPGESARTPFGSVQTSMSVNGL